MIEDLRQAHDALIEEILQTNQDLTDRIFDAKLRVIVDHDDDLFILELNGPQVCMTESIENSIYLRVDPESLKINSIEIPNFQRMAEVLPSLRRLVALVVTIAAATGGIIEGLPVPAEKPDLQDLRAQLAPTLRELALV